MALMILPMFKRGWKFGFRSVTEMLVWICLNVLSLYLFLKGAHIPAEQEAIQTKTSVSPDNWYPN